MVFASLLFNALFVVNLLWVGGNAITWGLWGKYFITPGFGVGKSMEPAIPGGITAYIEHYPRTVQLGDVVIFMYGDESICHRVVEEDGDCVRIKGDNNDFGDGWFRKDEIVGKVWSPFGRTLYIPLSPYAIRYTIGGVVYHD